MQDEDLTAVQRIRSGEAEAYAPLVRKYESRIRGYCLGVLGNAAEADDAAQEIFLKAYRGLRGFRAQAQFATWLYRIAVNHCRDLLRKLERTRKVESWDALKEQEGDLLEAQVLKNSPGPAVEESASRVRETLDRLPEAYKVILLLREVEGLSYQQLAETLGCSLDAVKARLRRARQELEAKFKGGGGV